MPFYFISLRQTEQKVASTAVCFDGAPEGNNWREIRLGRSVLKRFFENR